MSSKNYKSNATIGIRKATSLRETKDGNKELQEDLLFFGKVPGEEVGDTIVGVLKNNHLRNLYADFCILNQEFLSYVVACNLSKVQLNLLFFLMSEMDRENKILINNELLVKKLGATEKTIIEAIKKLTEKKIVLRQKLGVARYELQINYDILNPQLAFKNKATKENVSAHKALMRQETPYIKQQNIFGDIDLMHPNSGEVFYTIPSSDAHKHLVGTIRAKETLPQGYIEAEEVEDNVTMLTEEEEAEQRELNKQLAEEQKEREKMYEATMALEDVLNKYSQWEVKHLSEDKEEQNPYESKKIKLENLVESLEKQFNRKFKYRNND